MNSEDSACIRDAALSHISNVGNELYEAAEKLNSYAVAYKLIPFRDGNQWCVLLGADLQVGIAGFGDTPAKAIADFERSMHSSVKDSLTTAQAQPAVPDDAVRLALVWRVATGRESDEERATLGNVSPDARYEDFIAGIDAAILAASQRKEGA